MYDADGNEFDEKKAIKIAIELLKQDYPGDSDFDKGMRLLKEKMMEKYPSIMGKVKIRKSDK